jgi:hypothetical protein
MGKCFWPKRKDVIGALPFSMAVLYDNERSWTGLHSH